MERRNCGVKNVALVGSGITGLGAAWILHKNGFRVTLFEKEDRCGGHTLTDDSGPYPVDLGFQVYNLTTYPHLTGFLDALGVDTEPSDMSFGLSMDQGRLEWGSHHLGSIFAQKKNLASPAFWRMIWDVIRFGKEAPEVLKPELQSVYGRMSLGEYLKLKKYSQFFQDNYVLPMCAAVWSVPNRQVLAFPVTMLIRFWANHHLLDLFQRPVWRVVKGRSRTYVNAVLKDVTDVRTSCGVASVKSLGPEGPVEVATEAGEKLVFDAVVLATHSDISLKMVAGNSSQSVCDVLSGIPYNDNAVYLHTDRSLMPRDERVWASWNFLGSTDDSASSSPVCVTYWLNLLQHLPPDAPQMFCTLNPPHPPAPETIYRELKLSHPVFSFDSVNSQQQLENIQGEGGIYFAGAWAGYGFHEDGLKAAVEVTKKLGARLPWTPVASSPKLTLVDNLCITIFDKFARGAIRRGYLRIILPNGEELGYGNEKDVEPDVVPADRWRGQPDLRAVVRVLRPDFFRKVMLRHDTGLGESYMEGDFETDSLGGLMAILCNNANNIQSNRGALSVLNWFGDRLLHWSHRQRSNTLEGSRKNISEHYDAGNAMYKAFLDQSMTYSSGIHRPGEDLHQAQLNKLDALIDKAGISSSHHVLEIGCGWGSFAIRAAQRTGCRVTGVTISQAQLTEVQARVKAAGLEERVSLILCDYRELPGESRFDVVVSCEMIEAVGEEHMDSYFETIGRQLKPGGKAVVQAICEPDERYDAYCNSSDFIREHIFPGGHLPAMKAMLKSARGTGLYIRDVQDIGVDYAVTLREWRDRWEKQREVILSLGYDDVFWRKYRFYFAYCEAGFDMKYIHNFQIVWLKDSAHTNASPRLPSVSQVSQVSPLSPTSVSPSDPVTQVLLAIYFFLAGVAVSTSSMLWVMPTVSSACVIGGALTHKICSAVLPTFRKLEFQDQAVCSNTIVHALYSCIASASVMMYFLVALGGVPVALSALSVSKVCVCMAAGFCGFQLWTHVRNRLYSHSYGSVLQYTLLLCMYSCAAVKGIHTVILTLVMAAEVHAAVEAAGKLQTLWRGLASAECKRPSRLWRAFESSAFIAFRLVPHAFVLYQVLASDAPAGPPLYDHIVWSGITYLNVLNVVTLARRL